MAYPSNSPNPPKKKWLSTYARFSTLGFSMVAFILMGVFGGQFLDKLTGFKFPLFTVVLTLTGLAASLYYLIKEVTKK